MADLRRRTFRDYYVYSNLIIFYTNSLSSRYGVCMERGEQVHTMSFP